MRRDRLEANVAQFKALGADILSSKYETKLSSFSCPEPDAVKVWADPHLSLPLATLRRWLLVSHYVLCCAVLCCGAET
jgi:hypothetical protein